MDSQNPNPDVPADDLTVFAAPSALEKLDFVWASLKRIEPLIAMAEEKLPDFLDQVGPIIEGAKNSPVLKMLGIKL